MLGRNSKFDQRRHQHDQGGSNQGESQLTSAMIRGINRMIRHINIGTGVSPRRRGRALRSTRPKLNGFTLIELLVVIAIIAILVGILLPALGSARKEARTGLCGANARSIAQAVTIYSGDHKGYIPPSYVYGADQTTGDWRFEDQLISNPTPLNGYVHWSYALLASDSVPEGAFRCPEVLNGGAPATNPGFRVEDWETTWQQNDLGQDFSPSGPEDRQAHRMSYTGNAAIFPRNKFSLAGSQRRNMLVIDANITFPVKTILATEFIQENEWQSIADGFTSKSHRPITPFIGGSSGADVYNEPLGGGNVPRFFYPSESQLLELSAVGPGMIAHGGTTLNAVGRHHPGGDKRYGGTANFVFMDGHVERMTVLDSIRKKKWGDRFYSISGSNKVDTH